MNHKTHHALRSALIVALCAPLAGHATTVTLPEPGTWSLLALGLAAAAVVSIRKRRK